MKLYVLTTGYYSDYSIVAIFSSKEKLDEYKSTFPDEDYNNTEEYELNPEYEAKIKSGYSLYYVLMLKDGTTERVDKEDKPSHWKFKEKASIWKRSKAPAYKGKGIPDALKTWVLAKSIEHAVKIANEQRVQMIALGEF